MGAMLTRAKLRSALAATTMETPKFNYESERVLAKVLDCYDADTVWVAADLFGGGIRRHRIRFNGIDTPEMKDDDEGVKAYAIEARAHVVAKVAEKIVELEVQGMGMYGRLMGEIFVDNKSLSKELLELGYALPYSGKTKRPDWRQELRDRSAKSESP